MYVEDSGEEINIYPVDIACFVSFIIVWFVRWLYGL